MITYLNVFSFSSSWLMIHQWWIYQDNTRPTFADNCAILTSSATNMPPHLSARASRIPSRGRGVPSVIIIGRLSIIHPSHVASVILIRKLSIISILSTISHHHVKRKEPEYNVITLIANRAFSSSNILTMILNISNIRSFYFEFCCSTTGAAFPF